MEVVSPGEEVVEYVVALFAGTLASCSWLGRIGTGK